MLIHVRMLGQGQQKVVTVGGMMRRQVEERLATEWVNCQQLHKRTEYKGTV